MGIVGRREIELLAASVALAGCLGDEGNATLDGGASGGVVDTEADGESVDATGVSDDPDSEDETGDSAEPIMLPLDTVCFDTFEATPIPRLHYANFGDFDGDGLVDFVRFVPGSSTARLALHRGAGIPLWESGPLVQAPGASPSDAVVDFDADGIEEYVLRVADGFRIVALEDDDAFEPGPARPLASQQVVFLDYSGDGATDYIAIHDRRLTAYRGLGPGTFTEEGTIALTGVDPLVSVRPLANAAGFVARSVPELGSPTLHAVEIGPSGEFGAHIRTEIPKDSAIGSIGDIDLDGTVEVVVSTSDERRAYSLGASWQAWTDPLPYGDVGFGDVDGDGLADALMSTGLHTTLKLSHAGEATIDWSAAPGIEIGPNSAFLDVGDVDGNGTPDVVIFELSNAEGTVAAALSTPCD